MFQKSGAVNQLDNQGKTILLKNIYTKPQQLSVANDTLKLKLATPKLKIPEAQSTNKLRAINEKIREVDPQDAIVYTPVVYAEPEQVDTIDQAFTSSRNGSRVINAHTRVRSLVNSGDNQIRLKITQFGERKFNTIRRGSIDSIVTDTLVVEFLNAKLLT